MPWRRGPRRRADATFTVLVVLVVAALAMIPTHALLSGTTTNGAGSVSSAERSPTNQPSVAGDLPWTYYRREASASATASAGATPAATASSGSARPRSDRGTAIGAATFWKFEENSGTRTADSSGRGNTGTLVNTPTWTIGTAGNALRFNGTTQYVQGTRAAVRTDASFSVAAWAFMTDKTTYRSAVTQDGTSVSAFRLQYDDSADRWAFVYKNGDSAGASADKAFDTGSPSLNTWYHLAGVYDRAAGNIKLYVNGRLKATTAHTTVWNATGPLAVGRSKFGGANSDFFAGRLDEVRAYPRALSATEVFALFRRP
ncbi:MAG TPA: LamG domain-containing protein [Actinoplanes sp.]|nr:LamG domain-containing protein [Actinoplanes sp.]